MKRIKSKDTAIELKLRKALWEKGYRYRKNVKDLPGKPDVVLTKYKIAIFCDGEFFHGKDWGDLEKRIFDGDNSAYWHDKIKKNIQRDMENNAQLRGKGWIVIRFWGKDIKNDIDGCIKTIEEAIMDNLLD